MVSIFFLIIILVSFWSVCCYDFSFWLSFVMISFDPSFLQDDYFDLFSFIVYIFLVFSLQKVMKVKRKITTKEET